MKFKYLIVVLLTFSFSEAQWLKEKGKGYYKLGSWSLLADEHFTNLGGVDPNASRGLFISSFFGHYGLSDKINLIGYIPLFVKIINLLKFLKLREKNTSLEGNLMA